jgi:hypothetical protein
MRPTQERCGPRQVVLDLPRTKGERHARLGRPLCVLRDTELPVDGDMEDFGVDAARSHSPDSSPHVSGLPWICERTTERMQSLARDG